MPDLTLLILIGAIVLALVAMGIGALTLRRRSLDRAERRELEGTDQPTTPGAAGDDDHDGTGVGGVLAPPCSTSSVRSTSRRLAPRACPSGW